MKEIVIYVITKNYIIVQEQHNTFLEKIEGNGYFELKYSLIRGTRELHIHKRDSPFFERRIILSNYPKYSEYSFYVNKHFNIKYIEKVIASNNKYKNFRTSTVYQNDFPKT